MGRGSRGRRRRRRGRAGVVGRTHHGRVPPCCPGTGGSTGCATPRCCASRSGNGCSTGWPGGAWPGRSARPASQVECDDRDGARPSGWPPAGRSRGSGSRPTTYWSTATGTSWVWAALERIVKGDATCLSIATASILAKVTRDRIMRVRGRALPRVRIRFQQGLPVPPAQDALQAYGPSAIHRRTWIFMEHLVWGGPPPAARAGRTPAGLSWKDSHGAPAGRGGGNGSGPGRAALLSACGSSDNGGAIQTPTTPAHGAGSTTSTVPGSASTLPGGN